MTEVFSFSEGDTPLLISIPHDGRELAPGQAERMTPAGLGLTDTDWHVRRLYEFVGEMGASVIAANYSRYVVDLNRPPSDEALYEGQLSTGLCPRQTFAGDAIYRDEQGVTDSETESRQRAYWRPYHEKIVTTLAALKHEFGCALLWDAHSIASEVPRLFPGRLHDLNLGTNDGESCAAEVIAPVLRIAKTSGFSAVLNGRFRGGFITRHYGQPQNDVHAIQLELAQGTYMDEKNLRYDATRAARLAGTIREMLETFMARGRL